jgi:hypothetical protein
MVKSLKGDDHIYAYEPFMLMSKVRCVSSKSPTEDTCASGLEVLCIGCLVGTPVALLNQFAYLKKRGPALPIEGE